MIEKYEPLTNPAGDGPSDTNPLLDELRDGAVVRSVSSSELATVYFHMDESERIVRTSFAGSPPAVRKQQYVSSIRFASAVADRMGSGRGEVVLTTPEELERRKHDHDIASGFLGLWWMEQRLETEGESDE